MSPSDAHARDPLAHPGYGSFDVERLCFVFSKGVIPPARAALPPQWTS
jgi:hypothetical protein